MGMQLVETPCLLTATAARGGSSLSLHGALPIWGWGRELACGGSAGRAVARLRGTGGIAVRVAARAMARAPSRRSDRKSTRLNSSHRGQIYAVLRVNRKTNNSYLSINLMRSLARL